MTHCVHGRTTIEQEIVDWRPPHQYTFREQQSRRRVRLDRVACAAGRRCRHAHRVASSAPRWPPPGDDDARRGRASAQGPAAELRCTVSSRPGDGGRLNAERARVDPSAAGEPASTLRLRWRVVERKVVVQARLVCLKAPRRAAQCWGRQQYGNGKSARSLAAPTSRQRGCGSPSRSSNAANATLLCTRRNADAFATAMRTPGASSGRAAASSHACSCVGSTTSIPRCATTISSVCKYYSGSVPASAVVDLLHPATEAHQAQRVRVEHLEVVAARTDARHDLTRGETGQLGVPAARAHRPRLPASHVRPLALRGLLSLHRGGAGVAAIRGQTSFGTLPLRVKTTRIALCPRSAVGSNMHGQPPSITAMPFCRP